jgi:hypothetical protein
MYLIPSIFAQMGPGFSPITAFRFGILSFFYLLFSFFLFSLIFWLVYLWLVKGKEKKE